MIDEINLKILRILQEKARIPNVEVARQVDMAPSAVLERIRKLEREGIIDGYEVRLNPRRCGRSLVAFVWVTGREAGSDESLGRQLGAIADVLEVHYVSGDDGYLVKMRVPDAAALGRIVRERIQRIPGVVSTRTQVAMETYKESVQIPLESID